MTIRSELVAALQALPPDAKVRVQIGDRDGEIAVSDLLALAPQSLSQRKATDAVRVRLLPGGDQVGVLQKGWAVDTLPGKVDGFTRVVLYVKSDYLG